MNPMKPAKMKINEIPDPFPLPTRCEKKVLKPEVPFINGSKI